AERIGHAGLEMRAKDHGIHTLERLLDRHRLLQDVDAVLILFDHPLDGFEMALDRSKPRGHVLLGVGLHARHRTAGPGGWGRGGRAHPPYSAGATSAPVAA